MASMCSEWIEVQIRASIDSGEVLTLLDDPHVTGAWQDGDTIHLYWPADRWTSNHLANVCNTVRRLMDGVVDPDIVVHCLPDQDWNRQWAQSVKPLRVGKRIVIRPSWEPAESGEALIEIILDPKQAFGTGHHATTRLLLEWIEEEIRGGESVLDVGTGSGLLAMVALRIGAGTALGIDHDAEAIDCAREYAQVNGFGQELALRCVTLETLRPYDLVLANLDRGTLLELVRPLAANTGGTLLVSGLLEEQRREILDAFARAGLYPGRERKREGWLAMEFTRPESCEGV